MAGPLDRARHRRLRKTPGHGLSQELPNSIHEVQQVLIHLLLTTILAPPKLIPIVRKDHRGDPDMYLYVYEPREAARRGVVNRVLPLSDIGENIIRECRG